MLVRHGCATRRPQIVYGWTRDTSREEYLRRVADGSLGELFRQIDLKTGERFTFRTASCTQSVPA